MQDEERLTLATRVREACIEAALVGYDDAAIAGLCEDGAIEAAIGAIQKLDLQSVIDSPEPGKT
ncbi:acetyltransferase [Modicisalibacter radicis]|uniref:acetyltransferase n=1 Tax=Halomonas sp. EAR18 TaxID=2518972 RepID=UPI00109C1716|nr:acetyltransferase [Halomonas sp. EAR18]